MSLNIPYKYAASLAVALGLFMAVLDSTIVNVALATMETSFKTNINAIQWVVTGYTLAQAAVIPAAGYLANRFGIKRLYMAALAIFTVGSLLCGLSPHLASADSGDKWLIIFRVFQGLGGGMLFPLGMAITFSVFRPEERAAASALVSIPVLMAPAFGPTIGGLIVDSSFGWPGIFFINIPVGIITLVLLGRVLKPDPDRHAKEGEPGFDWTGLALSMLGVVLLVYAFALVSETKAGTITTQNPNGIVNGWSYWLVWLIGGVGLALLAAFGVWELRFARDPVLDLRLYASHDFTVASLVTWAVRGAIFGSFLVVPLFLQQFQGRSAVEAGLIMMAGGIGSILGIQTGARLFDVIGPRRLVLLGMVALIGGTAPLIWTKPDSGAWFFAPILLIRGIGFGWSNMPLQTVALQSLSGNELPKASSLYNATGQVFTSIGVAVVSTLLVQHVTSHSSRIVADAQAAGHAIPVDFLLHAGAAATGDVFRILSVATVAVILICLLLPRQSIKQRMAAGDESVEGAIPKRVAVPFD